MRVVIAIGIALVFAAGSPAAARGLFDPIPMMVPNPAASPGYVHLGSRASEASAEAVLAEQVGRWGKLFEGHSPLIQRIDLGSKGIRFRVLIKTRTMGDAARICLNIQAAGGDCFAGPL